MYVSSWIMVGLCLKNTLLTCNNWFNWQEEWRPRTWFQEEERYTAICDLHCFRCPIWNTLL